MQTPLADRVRPKNIDEVAGQRHLLAEGKILRKIIDSGDIPNLIFYGPSGVGKTTVAKIIASQTGKKLCYLNATTSSTADIKEIIGEIGTMEAASGILLYLDEIQYFNKKQQQILLSYIENGDITLIASTTENPYFYVYNAILSRSTVFEFKTLSSEDISVVLKRAIGILCEENGKKIATTDDSINKIARAAAGDVRRALNMLELCVMLTINDDEPEVSDDIVEQILAGNSVRYDREGDEHYDIVSAYQKSMRGSDPDAAIYYLARLLAAGDLPSACRRLLVCANEDVGLAYPQIIPIVKAAVDTAMTVGLPEARLPLANAVILVATSPKSVSAHDAINDAMADVEHGIGGDIPRHLQNKHFDGEDAEIKGQHYLYPHSYPMHYVNQQYLPDNIKNKVYYKFGDNKNEQSFKEYWDKIKNK
ncbi:MAG: replication-associated recombination protein A [Clostridia bacterium]|nr:replication-associated recombination protein A [Clostridia bacterium]MBQ6718341.1 replication-associated recombination protein A [Clostridia bacterium]